MTGNCHLASECVLSMFTPATPTRGHTLSQTRRSKVSPAQADQGGGGIPVSSDGCSLGQRRGVLTQHQDEADRAEELV